MKTTQNNSGHGAAALRGQLARAIVRRDQSASVAKSDHAPCVPAPHSNGNSHQTRAVNGHGKPAVSRRGQSMGATKNGHKGVAPAPHSSGHRTHVLKKDQSESAAAARSRDKSASSRRQKLGAPGTNSSDHEARAQKGQCAPVTAARSQNKSAVKNGQVSGAPRTLPASAGGTDQISGVREDHRKRVGADNWRPDSPRQLALMRDRRMQFPDLVYDIRDLWREHIGLERARITVSNRISADERRQAFLRVAATGAQPELAMKFPEVTDADKAVVMVSRARLYSVLDYLKQLDVEVDKELKHLVRQLPVWSFASTVKGFAEMSLASVVGGAGNLAAYSNYSKLWKRMGVGLVDGKVQRRVSTTVDADGNRIRITGDDALRIGYNSERAASVRVIGYALIKQDGPYRDVYLQRKQYETEKAKAAGLQVLPAAKISASNRADCMSLGHIDNRALRYMEKRLLKHLWQAWRRCDHAPDHIIDVPAMRIRRSSNGNGHLATA